MKKITYIYLIRHSEPLIIKNKVDYEDSQIANEKLTLSVEGEQKAKEISLLEELNDLDGLWCSNYVRAIATAKYIAAKNNIQINIDENFNERKLRRFKRTRRIRKNEKVFFYNRTTIG